MLQVWGRKTSSNVQAVMWGVAELDVPVMRYDVGHRFGGNDTPEFRAMNPNGLVPVVKDGDDGEPLWESCAILRYLASRYAPPAFWPADLQKRASVDKWAEWSKINVAAGFTAPIFWPLVRLPAKDRDRAAIDRAAKALGRHLTIADAQLSSRPFLAGEDLTLADIVFGHILYRYYDVAIERPHLPYLERYYDALTKRPAYRDHVMLSYDDLKAD